MRAAALACLLLFASSTSACGGEDAVVPPPEPGRVDITIDASQCDAPCPIARFTYFVTPSENYTCSYQDGTATPGKEVVMPSFEPPASGKVGLAVIGYCAAADDCPRCFALLDVNLADKATRTVKLTGVPFCFGIPIPLPVLRCSS